MRAKTIDIELVGSTARTFLTRGVVPSTSQVIDAIGFGAPADIRPFLLKFLNEELARVSVEVLELRKGRGDSQSRADFDSGGASSNQDDILQLSDRIESINERLRDAMVAHEEERVAHDATRRELLARVAAEQARADRERARCRALSNRLVEIMAALLPAVANDPKFRIEARTAADLFAAVDPDGSEDDPLSLSFGGIRVPASLQREDAAAPRPVFDRDDDSSLAVLRDLFADDDDEADAGHQEAAADFAGDPEDDEALVLEEAEEEAEEEEAEEEGGGEEENDILHAGFDRPSLARAHPPAPEPDDSAGDDIASILARLRAKDDHPAPREKDQGYTRLLDQAARDGGSAAYDDKPPTKPKRGFFRRG